MILRRLQPICWLALMLVLMPLRKVWAGNITAVWANDGGDKVSRDELRISRQKENLTGKTINRTWDGHTITLFGAHNEVVSFNLVLEAPSAQAGNVSVSFDSLTGPNGAKIADTFHPTTDNFGASFFNWVGRPIELFYTRYQQITGLSYLGTFNQDNLVPIRFKPVGGSAWTNRPDANKFYPDPLVPLELVPAFTIAAGQNQSIWGDIYIPKTAPAGLYTGQVIVKENGSVSWTIPIQLTLYPFTLPDKPSATTFAWLSADNFQTLLLGYKLNTITNPPSPDQVRADNAFDRAYQVLHRHKMDAIGETICIQDPPCPYGVTNCTPCPRMLPRLNGTLFTAANGYDGPGVGVGVQTYSIATWGNLSWQWADEQSAWNSMDTWEKWFEANSPQTERFIYLCDEAGCNLSNAEKWSQWIRDDPGPGHNILSFATRPMVWAYNDVPSLEVPCTPGGGATCPLNANGSYQETCSNMLSMNASTAQFYKTTPGRRLWAYNGGEPFTGSMNTEADGVSMRELPWGQYKLGIQRWFYWLANGFNAHPFTDPVTFYTSPPAISSTQCAPDASLGHTGCDNGNAMLVYPGADIRNPSDSYGVDGVFPSVRLNAWRRGIQDVDYLVLAAAINPQAVQALVQSMVPYAQWQYPTTDIWGTGLTSKSWSSDPDVWEAARAQLAAIISGSQTVINACDVNDDGSVNVMDVQSAVNETFGMAPCQADVTKDGSCTVTDVQRVVNASLGLQCVSP